MAKTLWIIHKTVDARAFALADTHANTQREKKRNDWSNGIDVFLARVLLFLFLVFSLDEPSRRDGGREETMCDVIFFPTVRLQLQKRHQE